jgi:hypothetical protein
MSRLQLQVELDPAEIALALRTVRVATGKSQPDAAAMLGLTQNGLAGRESPRGVHTLEDIKSHLATFGYKAVLVITNDEGRNNGTVRSGNGVRRTTA